MEKLERLRKNEIMKIGEKLELNVQKTMRKHELVRKIAEHMVDENVFEEAALEKLPTEIMRMTPEQIELEKIKIQAQMELERNKMELEKAKIQEETRMREVDLAIKGRERSHDSFEVTKQARLVPKFEEANVDGYFAQFERTALNLGWPKECWSMLLQTVLTGKAQRAYATLPTENCAAYDLVKAAVLKSFELVPEAYRQKFRTQRKTENQSYVEFLREKENALDKWCYSKRIDGDAEKLRQLILAEEFLNCVPEEVRVHLSERKTDVTYDMAALADEYILTHRKTKEKTFTGNRVKFKAELSPEGRPKEENRRTFQSSSKTVVCYKCGKAGHIAIRCQLGKGPERNRTQPRKPQGAVTTARADQSYRPWTKKGMIRGPHGGPVEVSILRDTGASQSLLLRNKLPKGITEATRETVMIEGIGGKRVKIPLCKITLKSQWKNGPIKAGVVEKLPMKGISLILGNEVKTKKCHPCKMAKMSAKNEERRTARRNAKHEDNMAAEPRARYKRHSRSQSEKVERKKAKLPHRNKQKDKGTSHQGKDKTPKNNGNKFPETYREDKKKMRGPSHMAKEEFEKGDEVLLLSSNKGPHCGGRYICPYVVTRRIDKRTYRIATHEGKKKTQVCHANKLKRYVRQEGPPRKIKNSEMPYKFEEKLSQLSVSEREGLEKLIKKIPRFISLTPDENVVVESSFIVVERKKERERETKRGEFSSPMLKYERNEKEIRQQVTKRGKREKKRKCSPQSWTIKSIKSSKMTKKERRRNLPP